MTTKDKIIAIDLGGTSAKLAIVSTEGEILQKWSENTVILNGGKAIVPNLIDSILERMDLYQLTTEDFLGIGMGSPGTVNHIDLTVTGAYNLNWVETQNVGEQFIEAFNLPFYLDNDANIAALGEQRHGSGDNASDVVMVTLGTGVGGGIIVDSQIVHGNSGAAGEIGHMTIDKDSGIACTCGKVGCLEALASATGLMNLTREYSEEYSGDSKIKQRIDNGEELSAKDIFEASEQHDVFAKHVVEQFGEYLGLGCSHIVNMLNPSKIILGGGVAQAGEYLREIVARHCDNYIFPALKGKTEIVIASLGNDAALLGAAELVNDGKLVG